MSKSLVKFPLISFTKDIGGAFCEDWKDLFDALDIENSNNYYVDVYSTGSENHKEWVDNYYNIVITKDFYKMYLFKELYDEYLKVKHTGNFPYVTNPGEYHIESFMRNNNLPLKSVALLDHKDDNKRVSKGEPKTFYHYEAVVL